MGEITETTAVENMLVEEEVLKSISENATESERIAAAKSLLPDDYMIVPKGPVYVLVEVICEDIEGFSAPAQAFVNETEARAGYALASLGTSYKLFSVPVWPEPAQSTLTVKALEG